MAIYVRKISNGICFPLDTHKHLVDGEKYELYDDKTNRAVSGPEKAAEASEGEGEGSDRLAQIVAAVKQIDPENYGKAAGGRPAMPKVAAVVALTGFTVKADEIAEAMEAISKG